MKFAQIQKQLDLNIVYLPNDDLFENEYHFAFASDLMSDALYLVNNESSSTILLTGLANPQSIRTAEMLDLTLIVYVRNKTVTDEMISLAKERQIALATYSGTLFKACGILYQEGMQSAS